MRTALLGLILIAVMTVTAYIPALTGPYVYDDMKIVRNTDLLTGEWQMPSPFQPRSLTQFLVAASLRTFGTSSTVLHIVNLALHASVIWLVWLLAGRIGLGPLPQWIAAAGFALHPVQTESVAYISDIAEVLSAGFMVAGIYAWVRWKSIVLILLCAAAALASKETGVALFLLAPVLIACHRGISWRTVAAAAGCVALLAAVGLKIYRTTGIAHNEVQPLQYWALQTEVFWRYVRMLFWPVQSVDWDAPAGYMPTSVNVIGILLLFGVLFAIKRTRLPALIFATTLVPMSVLPLYDVMVEHRLYFPMAGAALLFGLTLSAAEERIQHAHI